MFTMLNFSRVKRIFYVVFVMFMLSHGTYAGAGDGNNGMWGNLSGGVKKGTAGAGVVINIIFGIMVIILVVLAGSSYLGDGNKLKSYIIGIVVLGILWAVANAMLTSIA